MKVLNKLLIIRILIVVINIQVYYRCWESNPNITEWMKQNGYTLTKDVEQYYMSKVLKIANDIGYKVTVWQDVYDNNVKVNHLKNFLIL